MEVLENIPFGKRDPRAPWGWLWQFFVVETPLALPSAWIWGELVRGWAQGSAGTGHRGGDWAQVEVMGLV